MGSLSASFAELKRRRVIRTLVGYGIAAFAVLQIIEPVTHGLHWPETVLTYVVAALAARFPIVVILAWTGLVTLLRPRACVDRQSSPS